MTNEKQNIEPVRTEMGYCVLCGAWEEKKTAGIIFKKLTWF